MSTVRYLSTCARCKEDIASDHHDATGWTHIDTGEVLCNVEDPNPAGDSWADVATPTDVEDDWDDTPHPDRWGEDGES